MASVLIQKPYENERITITIFSGVAQFVLSAIDIETQKNIARYFRKAADDIEKNIEKYESVSG